MKATIILLATLCFGTALAQARNVPVLIGGTGRDFLANCGQIDSDETGVDTSVKLMDIACVYYVRGVADGLQAFVRPASKKSSDVCLSPSVTLTDLTKSVIRFIRSKAIYLDVDTDTLIYMELILDHSCG